MLIQGSKPTTKNLKIAVITSRFNEAVTFKLEEGALAYLKQANLDPTTQISTIRVPGAYELPLAAKYCLENHYDAVIALGAVIRGETSHYDYVCMATERGCSQLQLEYKKPVVFGLLTTENKEQALARAGGKKGHKGEEAAAVALEMLSLQNQIQG